MIFRGRVWKFGNNVDTDVIIPVQYSTGTDPKEMAAHCMEGLDPHFSRKVRAGDIVVAGKNFGCGSSREPAPLAIKGAGISCVIAGSFARIFYRNAFNIGLPLLECMEAQDCIEAGDEIEVDLDSGTIINLSRDEALQARAIPQFMQELIRDGGLMKHIARQLKERQPGNGF
jgi:3-isopropylmalate/(R)-2-methylmalate dehydratase small subunit